jgi:hypothetical protein
VKVEEARVLLGLRPGFSESEFADAVRNAERVWSPDQFDEGSERHQAAVARTRTLAQARTVLERSLRTPAAPSGPPEAHAGGPDAEVDSGQLGDAAGGVPPVAPSPPEPAPELETRPGLRSEPPSPSSTGDSVAPVRAGGRPRRLQPRFWLVGAALIAALLAGWFVTGWPVPIATLSRSGETAPVVDVSQNAQDSAAPEAASQGASGGADGALAESRPAAARQDPNTIGDAPDLPSAVAGRGASPDGPLFSVSVGAFRSFASAQSLAGRVANDSAVSWSAVAPVATAGGVYHRVLAGLVADSVGAHALGAELASRLGADVGGWFARPVALTVCSASFPDADGAREVIGAALAQELAGNVRPSEEGDFRACFGGYERPEELAEAIRRLGEAGYLGAVVPLTAGR